MSVTADCQLSKRTKTITLLALAAALLQLQGCSNPVPAQTVQGRWKMPDAEAEFLGLGRVPTLRMELDGSLFAECFPFGALEGWRCLDGPGKWNASKDIDRFIEVQIVNDKTLFIQELFFAVGEADRATIPRDPDRGEIPIYFAKVR